MTKLLTLAISFSTAVRAAIVAKLVILSISPLTSSILALREALVAKLVIAGILSSIFLILALYISFLIMPCFAATLSLLKSIGTGAYLSTSNLSTLLFQLLKSAGTFFNLSISNLNELNLSF